MRDHKVLNLQNGNFYDPACVVLRTARGFIGGTKLLVEFILLVKLH
jgi:hypothetical protein